MHYRIITRTTTGVTAMYIRLLQRMLLSRAVNMVVGILLAAQAQ